MVVLLDPTEDEETGEEVGVEEAFEVEALLVVDVLVEESVVGYDGDEVTFDVAVVFEVEDDVLNTVGSAADNVLLDVVIKGVNGCFEDGFLDVEDSDGLVFVVVCVLDPPDE